MAPALRMTRSIKEKLPNFFFLFTFDIEGINMWCKYLGMIGGAGLVSHVPSANGVVGSRPAPREIAVLNQPQPSIFYHFGHLLDYLGSQGASYLWIYLLLSMPRKVKSGYAHFICFIRECTY